MRASDADRERTVEALRAHAAAGRLEPAELEERVEAALGARTDEELDRLTADLPAAGGRAKPRRELVPVRHRRALAGPLAVTALLLTIWLATGAGHFWPMWPLIGMFFWARAGYGHGCAKRRGSSHACSARPPSRRDQGDEAWV
jgi:hypothetical protein